MMQVRAVVLAWAAALASAAWPARAEEVLRWAERHGGAGATRF